MDLNTSYVFYATLLALYAIVLASMAWADRRLVGARWLAYSVGIELVKTVLQGMGPRLPRSLSTMTANELNVAAYFSMYMGFRWFVRREPVESKAGPVAVLATMAIYYGMFAWHVPFALHVIAAPIVAICGATVVLMLRQKEDRFLVPGRIAAVLMLTQIGLILYRVAIVTPRYLNGDFRTWRAPMTDPRWVYSMFALLLTSSCLLLIYLWFAAVEMYSTVEATAGMDALTGCLNRRSLMKLASHELARSERTGLPLSIAAIDIDHFKQVNDTYGHGGGDATLCSLCALFKERLRAVDIVARTGGEEFLVLLPDTDAPDAAAIMNDLRTAVEEMRLEHEGLTISTTVSVGVTQRLRSDTWTAIVARADRALYAAKREGRNRLMVDEQVLHLPRRAVAVREEMEGGSERNSRNSRSSLRLIRKRRG